jgi:purine-binding chemotaxis protein CheW
MVDLVKIRKKAKAKAEAQSAERRAQEPAPPAADVATPSDPVPRTPSPVPESTITDRLQKFLETAGTRRAASAKDETQKAEREVLTFVIDRENYAVDIDRVASIIATRPITRVPNADKSIVGIISLRGTVVTLMDVRGKLGHPNRSGPASDRRVIILDHDGESIGFEVDRVMRVVKVDPNDIEPHPVVHASEADESIQGVFRHGDALTILLDFAKLLASGGPVSVVRGRSAGVRAPRS